MFRSLSCAVTVLGALSMSGCGEQSSAGAVEVLDVRPSTVEGRDVQVRVPSGGIILTVGEPITDAPSEVASIPSGSVLVPVQWQLDRRPAAPFTNFASETQVTIQSGQESSVLVTIPDSPTAGSEAYVVVPGDGQNVGFEVTYDGVTQSVDPTGEVDAGPAALLYDEAAAGVESTCSPADFELGEVVFECSLQSWVVPYDPDQGWAKVGEQFLAVAPRLNLARVVDGRERSATSFVTDASRLDEVAPVRQLELGTQGPGSVTGLLVASVPEAPTHVWNADLTFLVEEGPREGMQLQLDADFPLG